MNTIAPGTESSRITLLAISTGFSGSPSVASWATCPITCTATSTGRTAECKSDIFATFVGRTTSERFKCTARRSLGLVPAGPGYERLIDTGCEIKKKLRTRLAVAGVV